MSTAAQAHPTVPLDDQGPTYRCGPFAAREWFEAYGHDVASSQAWQDAIAKADAQHGSSFADEQGYITAFATAASATLQWLDDGFLRDFPTFEQAVRDGWCVVVGVLESDLHPGQSYYHFLAVDGIDPISVKDSFSAYDGETGHPSLSDLEQGIRDNWDPTVIGLAFKLS